MTLGSWISAGDGDASGLWFQSLLAALAFPKAFVWGQMASAGWPTRRPRASTSRPAEPARLDHRRSRGRSSGAAAAWPTPGRPTPTENEYSRVRTSNVETLADRRRAGLRDAAAGRDEGAPAVPAERPPGRAARVRPLDDVLDEQPKASTRLLNTFLDTGKVDDSLYKPQKVDFTPEVTQTALGKGLAGDDDRASRCSCRSRCS